MPCRVTPVTCRFPTMQPSNDGFHHQTACHTISHENVQFRSAPSATGLFSHFPHQFDSRFYHVALLSRGRNTRRDLRWT